MLNIRYKEKTSTWPGFVDLFSNLVIILIFLLIVFVFLWTTTSVFNKSSGVRTVNELRQTNAEQAALIEQMKNDESEAKRLLLLARDEINSNEASFADLSKGYEQQLQEKSNLIEQYKGQINELEAQVSRQMDERQKLIDKTAEIRTKLEAQAETQAAIANAEIEKLQKELATAQAEVDNLSQYQSAFYKAIKDALGNRTIMRPEGDRFIISSDILFPSGKYTLSANGKKQLAAIANVIKDFESQIDPNVKWIIRVDGHTDNKPVVAGTHAYRNNLQLSMLRANAVVDELAKNGVSKRRLVPSGFGDLHPIELGKDVNALRKNRRIELQLTNR